MVLGRWDNCNVCGERFAVHEERLGYGRSGYGFSKVYHFHCVDYETPLDPSSRGEWAFWKLRQVDEAHGQELEVLRGRTTSLYELALRLMSRLEFKPDEVEDFKFEYGFGGQDPGASDSGCQGSEDVA